MTDAVPNYDRVTVDVKDALYQYAQLTKGLLFAAPSVDAEVVRHGRWIKENIRVKSYLRLCSACNKIAYFCGSGCSYAFCPNCGARMDGEQNDIQRV